MGRLFILRKKIVVDIDVVTAAKKRIKNIFSVAPRISFNTSGGKDSTVLSDLLFKMCVAGVIDKSKLCVEFIDEEAIYPCVEKCVIDWRKKWLSIGVKFYWYCMPFRHFSCFNSLTQDESFILWEPGKKWIRDMPSFSIKSHPMFKNGDTYQDFLNRKNKSCITLLGVRASESVQRQSYLSKMDFSKSLKQYPIYDWQDSDVWKYIRDNNLEIPNAYMFMYQCGVQKRNLRISQFFSVDTASSLVKMCEYYPGLFDKICEREPNAYMAMLYYDTELFRHDKKSKASENVDYKKKFFDYISDSSKFNTKLEKKIRRDYLNRVLIMGKYFTKKEWKMCYEALVGGDPKERVLRALFTNVGINKREEYNKGVK